MIPCYSGGMEHRQADCTHYHGFLLGRDDVRGIKHTTFGELHHMLQGATVKPLDEWPQPIVDMDGNTTCALKHYEIGAEWDSDRELVTILRTNRKLDV